MSNQYDHKPFLKHPWISLSHPTINAFISYKVILQNLRCIKHLERTNNESHYIFKSIGQHPWDDFIQTTHEVDWSESSFRLGNKGGLHTHVDPSSAQQIFPEDPVYRHLVILVEDQRKHVWTKSFTSLNHKDRSVHLLWIMLLSPLSCGLTHNSL